MSEFEAVIGLEVHAQLSTVSKIFAVSGTQANELPNTLTDPTTLGLPGCLPVLNKQAVEYAIKLGVATNCKIARESIFARKHYLYPDLPKGYQISQYDKPICENGFIDVYFSGETKRIGITRIHLEEDAGKNIHLEQEATSIVDLNRAGIPLVEIVSEPELRSSEEAAAYMRELRQIVRYLGICDGNMEEGSLRCDANVSVRRKGATEFGTKVEIKNLNSFRHVEKAIAFEIERQTEVITQGTEKVIQETRLWDEARGITKTMRSKEFAEDYRYFPDPDLLPLIVDEEWVDRVRDTLPELPHQVFERFQKMYGLDEYLCDVLTEEKLVAQFFDRAVSAHNNPPAIGNWISTELFGRLNKDSLTIENCPVSPENLAALVKLIDAEVISGKLAKSIFDEMFSTSNSPDDIVEAKGLKQITDEAFIASVIDRIIEQHPGQVADFRKGKMNLLGFFVGQVMKETHGKANPKIVNQLLLAKLKK